MEVMLEILFLSIVSVCACADVSWNDPTARMSNLLYVAYAIAFAECAAAAYSGGWSTNTTARNVNLEVTRTNLC